MEVSEAGHRAWANDFIKNTVPLLLTQIVEQTNTKQGQAEESSKTHAKSEGSVLVCLIVFGIT